MNIGREESLEVLSHASYIDAEYQRPRSSVWIEQRFPKPLVGSSTLPGGTSKALLAGPSIEPADFNVLNVLPATL